ncbi:NAD-dependent succinate-semialdehyde dehydrogenase [Bifidobacterium apri]|uniref:Succinate-semialdehyde dehydrogenase n=2 Tax=Bifidobacterium apri TaxID=1769423 RepID=A0A6A2V9Z9_9BIFI|nr:succinate-semialdehyde dehydrogenase [Bifidobacterium apri]
MSRYAVTNPATGQVEESFETFTDEQVAAAVDAADEAYRTWGRTTTIEQRAALMRKAVAAYRDQQQELATIINHEMGKLMDEALVEVEFSAEILEYYADHAAEFLADEPIDRAAAGTAFIRHLPIGPLVGVMPWNYPYYQVARFAGPNLMLGNTIMLKHASLCPKSSAAMERIFLEAGFPKGAFVNMYATNEQIAKVIADPRVRGVSLTGSERAGKAIAQEAGAALKKVVCELGGNDAFIVMSTDDLDAAVEAGANARYENSGQICNGAKRFIIIDSLYDEFLKRFIAVSKERKLAPLCSASAADGLAAQVQAAIDDGATVVLGGAEHDGAFYPATILTDIPEGSAARHTEFFGPVAQFYRVSSEDEAIAVANDSPYGLGSYVFTTDSEQGLRFADRLESGMTYINESGADSAELPFGGVKNSGFGREMGPLGIREFANYKLITEAAR